MPPRIPGLNAPDGAVTVGFRTEVVNVTQGEGQIAAPIYTVELLGDSTMITVRVGGTMVSVKAAKDFRADIGQAVSFSVAPAICHLFDMSTEARLDAGT